MSSVIVKNDRYTVDPLYQWDINQKLKISGLSLASAPEIHFTNEAMSGVIVRQASVNSVRVITVDIPNSLLQKPYTITAYVCIYEGETFKSVCKIDIPIKARKMPNDYTLVNDEEIYSFNALENKLNAEATALNLKYEELKTDYDGLSKDVADLKENGAGGGTISETIENIERRIGDIEDTIPDKQNKPSLIEWLMNAFNWSNNTYSFEDSFPADSYDIEISVNSTATIEQLEAFNMAQILGSLNNNIVVALGDVPAIDIPIIIKAVAK